jgi:GNAT superfamily N-acetyltransferase
VGAEAAGSGLSNARLERAEAAAFGDMWACLGLPRCETAGAASFALAMDRANTMLNRVIGLGLGDPASDAVLDQIDAFFHEAGSTRYSISIAPDGEPGLADRLQARGFTEGYAWMRFVRGLEPAPPVETALRVEQAEDGELFGRIVAAGFELPPEAGHGFAALAERPAWHLMMAFDGATPVASAALVEHDGVGWFGAAATLPEHRRKGAQNALLAARIERARQLGLDVLTVETGELGEDRPSASYRNILRAGFEELYLRPNFLSPE